MGLATTIWIIWGILAAILWVAEANRERLCAEHRFSNGKIRTTF